MHIAYIKRTILKTKKVSFTSIAWKHHKEVAMDEGKKSCGEGQYFNDDQKCKPIPKGAKVNKDGILEGAAWTKKSGKNKEGGLNEKGRKSYERENPGLDLKAPSKKKETSEEQVSVLE